MSGENQYISPIIDAFLRRRQQDQAVAQEGQKNQIEQQRVENENKYREALIKEAGERLQNAHEEHQRNMDLLSQAHENASLTAKSNTLKGLQEAVRNAPAGKADEAAGNYLKALGGTFTPQGGNPLTIGGQTLPGSPTATGTFPIPGTGQSEPLNISALPNATDIAQNAGLKAGDVINSQLPAKEILAQQQADARHNDIITKSVEGLRNALAIGEQRGMTQVQLKKMADDANLAIANGHNSTTLAHAKILMGDDPTLTQGQAGVQAERNANNYWSILDGQDPKLSKAENMGVASFANDIHSEVPGKHIGEIVNAYKQTGPLLDQAELLAKEVSRDSPKDSILPNGVVASLTGTTTGKLFNVGQEADAAIKQFNTRAAMLAAANDPKARLINSILASQVSGLIDPTKDYAVNHKAIEDSRKLTAQTFNQSISGLPPSVGSALKARSGILAMETKGAPIAPLDSKTVPKSGMPITLPPPGGAPGHVQWPNASKAKGYNIYGSGAEPPNWQDYQGNFPPPPTQSPTAVQPQNPQVAQ